VSLLSLLRPPRGTGRAGRHGGEDRALEVELFYSLSDPTSMDVLERTRAVADRYGIRVRETLGAIHRYRSWRRGVRAVPTLQVAGRTVWIGDIPDEILERIFRELIQGRSHPARYEVGRRRGVRTAGAHRRATDR